MTAGGKEREASDRGRRWGAALGDAPVAREQKLPPERPVSMPPRVLVSATRG